MQRVRRFLVPFSYDDKIIQKSKDRVYYNVTLMTPGRYVDALTNEPALIKSDVLSEYALNWESFYLDIDHDVYSVLSRIGYVEPKGWDGKSVKANLKILPITQNARDVISLIDAGLITDVSVEMRTEEVWDYSSEAYVPQSITFTGVGIVTQGACPDAKIK